MRERRAIGKQPHLGRVKYGLDIPSGLGVNAFRLGKVAPLQMLHPASERLHVMQCLEMSAHGLLRNADSFADFDGGQPMLAVRAGIQQLEDFDDDLRGGRCCG